MSNAQLYLIMLVPMIGILTNVGLHLYLSGRIDRLVDTVGSLGERTTRLEEKVGTLGERMAKVEVRLTRLEETVSRIHV